MAVSGRVVFAESALAGASGVPCDEIFELPAGSTRRSVETGDCESADAGGSGKRAGTTTEPIDQESEDKHETKKRRRETSFSNHNLENRIEKMFKKYPCTPISNICKTQQWLAENDLRYLRDNNQKFQTVMDVLSNELIPYSIRQFTDMYRKPGCCPLFAMPRGINEIVVKNSDGIDEVVPYYLPDEETINILSQLLDFQTNHKTAEFLRTLVNILDKRVPKLNTMFVYAPPSSGKNFFFDFVLNFFLIRGQMMNIRKGEGFPYMDCVDRRVIMFNEPNIAESPSTMDTLKMLFGGDFCPAAVKFKAPTIIHRTPVFVLTNDCMLFRNVPAFADRMSKFEWKPAPFLKSVNGYPNPKMFPSLLEKYNVEF